MGDAVQCFMLTPTEQLQESLRRYVPSTKAKAKCTSPHGYHDASVVIGVTPNTDLGKDLVGDSKDDVSHTDPRWPTACICGYVFVEDDNWQHNRERLHKRGDAGEMVTLRGAPVGAMWYADWWPGSKGPDGRCLVVMTPAGEWMVDGPSRTDGKGWTRTGIPPNVTASPSIGLGKEGGGWRYHGWLRGGRLVEC